MRILTYLFSFIYLVLPSLVWSQTVVISDPNFKKCLAEKDASLLDTNQNLIIAKANAKIGALSCIGYQIESVEEITYFENLAEIYLSRNNIQNITAFPTNSNLTRLILDDNQLTSLPDLGVLPGLNTLTAKRNKLNSLPNLSSNSKLTQLYVQSNNLTVIPDLKTQKALWAINFSFNQLTSLPILDSLKKLKELVVGSNKLTEVQSLVRLPLLTFIDVSGNQLTALPQIMTNNVIETIHLENNNLSTLPDFTRFPKLKQAFLNDNYLTFEDLKPLENIPNYDMLFPISSQKKIKEGKNYSLKINDDFYFETNTDKSVAGALYTSYANGVEIDESNLGSTKVNTTSESFSGYYMYELRYSPFPNLILRTDSSFIAIAPCFTVNQFIIEVSPRTCIQNSGAIKVSSESSLPSGFQYELQTVDEKETLISSTGTFNGLGKPNYKLNGKMPNCKASITENIQVNDVPCQYAVITADGDGQDDKYFFNDEGEVTITDKFGNTVKKMRIPNEWNGSNNNGKVAPGLYFASINSGEKLIKITVVY